MIYLANSNINPIQDGKEGGGSKKPLPLPTNFSLVTSTNVGISPENFLTIIFDPFPTLVWSFMTNCQSQIKLEPRPPQKKWFFWSNPYNIKVMVTSLREVLELPNFGHMTTSTM